MLDVIAGALMVLVLGMALSRYSPRGRHTTVLLATFCPYSPALAAVAVALLLAAGHALPAAAAAVVGLVILGIQVRPWVTGRPPARLQPVLTVLTANLWEGRGSAEVIAAIVRARDVDVVALQEITQEALDAILAAGLAESHPHAVAAPEPRWDGTVLLSRHPLREPRITRHGNLTRVEAVVGLDPARPHLDPVAISLHILDPWPSPPRGWIEQLAELREDLPQRDRPMIVMGDFNATLDHRPFRELLGSGTTEAAIDAGAWHLRTFRASRLSPAVIWIDHVLLRGLRGISASSVRIPGSDHLGVVAVVGRPAEDQPT